MTIKPKRKKTGRNFGTRRQWRRVWRDRAWPLWMLEAHRAIFDVETAPLTFGVDVGRKDSSAVAIFQGEKLIVLRTLPVPDASPFEKLIADAREEINARTGIAWARLREQLATGKISMPTNEELIEELRQPRIDPYSDLALAMAYAFEVDKPRKLGKSPALAAPYGKSKDSG